MNNIDFTNRLIKGRIAETIFAQMFRNTGNYTVLEFGYEKIVPELVQRGQSEDNPVLETLRSAPDFAVINQSTKEVRLIEVKYRRELKTSEIRSCAERMHASWNPSYLFVATLNGFFFDEISTILSNNGQIANLTEISPNLQSSYLQILQTFERNS